MYTTVIAVLIISLLLAWWSLRDYQGDKTIQQIKEKRTKEQIKGGIVFEDNHKTKHYSSYS